MCENNKILTKSKDKILCSIPIDETYEVPQGVTTIGESAFKGDDRITTVTLPDSVTKIESSAFYECPQLKEIHYRGNKDVNSNQDAINDTITAVFVPNTYEGDTFCGVKVTKEDIPQPDPETSTGEEINPGSETSTGEEINPGSETSTGEEIIPGTETSTDEEPKPDPESKSTQTSNSEPEKQDTDGAKLSSGAIAGIVIAVIVVIVACVVCVVYFLVKRKPKEETNDELVEPVA